MQLAAQATSRAQGSALAGRLAELWS
jgi:hypothetical protein